MMLYFPGRRATLNVYGSGELIFTPITTLTGVNYKVTGSGIVTVIEISNTGRHYCREFKIVNGFLDQWLLKPPPSGWFNCQICHRPFVPSLRVA